MPTEGDRDSGALMWCSITTSDPVLGLEINTPGHKDRGRREGKGLGK